MVESIHQALEMPEEDQARHMEVMQRTIQRFNIHHWVTIFMDRLAYIKERQASLATHQMDDGAQARIKVQYVRAESRLLFLDYDGTLTGFVDDPAKAKPDEELRKIVARLGADPRNRVVIISGRGREDLGQWFLNDPIDIISEHGVWLREQGGEWETIDTLTNNWKQEMFPLLETYVNRTPGSFIEEKDYSLVWHYRKVETGLGELRTRELTSHLKYLTTNANLQVLEGNMVVEIKNLEVNKGRAALKWLSRFPSDWVLAIGDDWTDEDMFRSLPDEALTIKVGSTSSAAKFSLNSYIEVRRFLQTLLI